MKNLSGLFSKSRLFKKNAGNNVRLYVLVFFVVLFLTAAASSCGPDTAEGDRGTRRTGDINLFLSSLQSDNITVQEGKNVYVDALKMCSEGLIDNCFGNNAGSSYFFFQVPPAPGQDPAGGQDPPVGYDPNDPDNYPATIDVYPPGTTFKLRPDEALVFVGKTPPTCKYFGFTSYIFATENKPGKDYGSATTEGSGSVGFYHIIFGSLGDTLNQLNIRTEKTPGGLGDDSFDSTAVIIITADKGTGQRIRAALTQAGYPRSIVNDAIIPSGLVKMGLEKGKDTFGYLVRVSQFEDNNAGQDYIDNLDSYTRVFRLTPNSIAAPDPYPVPALKPRGSGQSEFKIMDDVSTDIDTLRSAILQEYATPDYTYSELNTSIVTPEGFIAYTSDINALGDNRDTTYLASDIFQLKSNDDFVVIYGLNHDKSGKSVYCNAIFYGIKYLNGVTSVYSDLFAGSADEYFPQGYANAENYYVYKMVRRNSAPGINCDNCVIIPRSTGNPNGKAFGVNNHQGAIIAFRAYVEEATGIGPSYFEILYDRAIIFYKKKSAGE